MTCYQCGKQMTTVSPNEDPLACRCMMVPNCERPKDIEELLAQNERLKALVRGVPRAFNTYVYYHKCEGFCPQCDWLARAKAEVGEK